MRIRVFIYGVVGMAVLFAMLSIGNVVIASSVPSTLPTPISAAQVKPPAAPKAAKPSPKQAPKVPQQPEQVCSQNDPCMKRVVLYI